MIVNKALQPDFRYSIKQKGAMMAKGRLIGIQFLELFKDNLYLEMAETANQFAYNISDALVKKGYDFLLPTATNQLFPILPNKDIDVLKEAFDFYIWSQISDTHSAIRWVTSGARDQSQVDILIEMIGSL